MIHIGFTGTQQGMTSVQAEVVWGLLRHKDFYGHHGDCIGADVEFDSIARKAPCFRGMIVHPCNIVAKRANVHINHPWDALLPVKTPLDRNHDIVDTCQIMIATPKELAPTLRSGTWATIRYARSKLGAALESLYIISPEGWYSQENNPS